MSQVLKALRTLDSKGVRPRPRTVPLLDDVPVAAAPAAPIVEPTAVVVEEPPAVVVKVQQAAVVVAPKAIEPAVVSPPVAPPPRVPRETPRSALAAAAPWARQIRDDTVARLPTAKAAAILLIAADGCDRAAIDHASAELAAAFAEIASGDVLRVLGPSAPGTAHDSLSRQDCPGWIDAAARGIDWRDAKQPTATPRVVDLPCGQFDRSTRLEPPLIAKLVSQWKRDFAGVLISISISAWDVTGPLARCADARFVLVQLGQTPRRSAQHAIKQLRRAGAPAAGSILLGT